MTQQLLGDGSEEHRLYAKTLLRTTLVPKTKKLRDELYEMSVSIFECPVRRGNRTMEQVCRSVTKSVLDRALCDLGGFRHNDGFDVTDHESYSYDAEDQAGGQRFEVKSLKEKWLSWRGDRPMRTFLRHSADISYLVGGKLWESDDDFKCSFMLLARAPSFANFIKPSMTPGAFYYHHIIAGREGEAVYRKEIA